MDNKQKAFFIQALRRSTFRWTPRYEAKNAVRVPANDPKNPRLKYKYKCACCGQYFPDKEIVLDHKEPVVPVNGFKNGMDFDANEYIERMLCDKDNYNVLCYYCHNIKTKGENDIRRENKKARKPPKIKKVTKKKGAVA